MTDTHADPVARLRAANGRGNAADGWLRPEYTNWIDEQLSWKETCYVGDWSFLSNYRLSGPDARELLSGLTVNSLASFPVGTAKHAIQCDDDGHVVAEGLLMRTGDESFELHGVPGYWTSYHLEAGGHDATGEWRDTFNLQVQGPESLAVLERLTDDGVGDLEFIHFGPVEVAGHDVVAVRMGMAGELGYELQGPAAHREAVWDAVVDAGRDLGIRRLGSRTALVNHLEACFPTRGRDYVPAIHGEAMAPYRRWLEAHADRDLLTYAVEGSVEADDASEWYRTPIELGWGGNVALDHEFVGRAALEPLVGAPERTIATLVWDDADVVSVYASLFDDGPTNKVMAMPRAQKRTMQADVVLADGDPVGVSTSRGYSYYFREMLSLATLDVAHAEPGTEVTVVWGEGGSPASPTVERHERRRIGATVAPAPYKADRRRVDVDGR